MFNSMRKSNKSVFDDIQKPVTRTNDYATLVSTVIMWLCVTVLTLSILTFLNLTESLVASVIVTVFANLFLAHWVWLRSHRLKMFEFGKNAIELGFFDEGKRLRSIAAGAVFGLAGFFAIQLLGSLYYSFVGEDSYSSTTQMISSTSGVEYFIVAVLGACVLIPITEEILFRGSIFELLKKNVNGRVSRVLAYVIPSLAFALLHTDGSPASVQVWVWVSMFALGLLFARTYSKFGIYAAITAHITYNVIVTLIAFSS